MNNNMFYQIMIFYSLLTFFAGPKIAKSMNLKTNDPCFVGMVIGFIVSIALWKQYGYNMVYKGAKTY